MSSNPRLFLDQGRPQGRPLDPGRPAGRPGLASASPRAVLGGVLLGLLGLATTGCENLAIGRTCEALADGGASATLFNDQALECPTRLCIKPARGALPDTQTAPFCTAECKSDKDCADAERRDPKNNRDKRCTQGFSCAVPFATGDLACKKLCVCRDFVPMAGLPTPPNCATGGR